MYSVQRVVVLPGEPVGTISRYLHGQFAEHLGELVYPGLCVAPGCGIPNTGGLRDDVIAALRPLGIPVLRWPGGCFADTYHWRDGVGPVESRPKRVNVHWGMADEPNRFGTHEFMAFCRAIGAEPYFAGNLGSGSPAELRDWVEYCNHAGSSTLADERRANGAEEPFRVRYWGIGNENWGCGGNMSPEAYAEAFCRYNSFLFNYPGAATEAIACGPNSNDWAWTRRFLECLKSGHTWGRLGQVHGFGAHYYCGTAGTATEYSETQWLELLARARAIEGIITGHRAIMDTFDPDRKIKLICDEWGAWHPAEAGKPSGGLYQQNTIRDACVAALTLDIFNNHADKLFMANIAQLVNVLQSLLLVEADRVVKTPTYHVFDLYRPHRGAQAVRLISCAETASEGEGSAQHCRSCYLDRQAPPLRAVHGSASILDGVLCVTAVNTLPAQSVDLEIELHSGKLDQVEIVTLSGDEIHAHNTFGEPERVRLSAPMMLQARGDRLRIPLAPASIVRLRGRLI